MKKRAPSGRKEHGRGRAPTSGARRRPEKGSLTKYRELRDFSRTPEPGPKKAARPRVQPEGRAGAGAECRFVVHRHQARHLHYDLRMQAGDALVCFAIPRGFSYDLKERHLAVHTEDHPLEYEWFEGVIPKGEYGAGTMTVFDRGTFLLRGKGDLRAALAAGKLEIVLCGLRLRGEWHLVRTGEDKDEWLILKTRDGRETARPEIAFELDLRAARLEPAPSRLRRMEPAAAGRAFDSAEFVFEAEHPGRRLFAIKRGGSIEWRDGQGSKVDLDCGAVEAALKRCRTGEVWLDGVLVACDEQGLESRAELECALGTGVKRPVSYHAIDVVRIEGWNVAPLPLKDRQRLLESLLPENSASLTVESGVAADGELFCRKAVEFGFAGVVAKRLSSPYQEGRSRDWLRIRLSAKRPGKKSIARLLQAATRGLSPARAITHSNKVYFPDCGITKGDVFRYYEQVGEVLVQHLRGRPLHLHRFPDGIEGESFYQKHLPASAPSFIRSRRWKDEEGRAFLVCEDLRTLLYLVNLGSIDFHPWMSRVDAPDQPDFAVLDLDPKQAPFTDVVRIARTLGKLLAGVGLKALLKTSGSTGMHVYLPLTRGYSYDQSRMLCEALARHVVREHPDIATVERNVAARGAKVYIDYMQNRRGQTIAAPYVVRPVPGARVSTPLSWDELRTGLDPSEFTIVTVPSRLRERRDSFVSSLSDGQDLSAALPKLERLLR